MSSRPWTNPSTDHPTPRVSAQGRTVRCILNQSSSKPAQKLRVAAYCRVSTDQAEQLNSLENQISAFRALVNRREGWKLIDTYVDEGVTGTSTAKRKAFMRMIRDCESGKIDYIITKSISRFARNTLECLTYVRKLKAMGIYILFEKENIDTSTAASEVLLSVLAAVAQEESYSISENMKWAFRKRYQMGIVPWKTTYGYIQGEDGEYVPDGIRAEAVRRIFDLYVKGTTTLQIMRIMEQEGYPTPSGERWYNKSVCNILGNEKYTGDVLLQKSITVDHLSHRRVLNDQTEIPSYYVEDHHTPLVDRKTFEMAQRIRQLRAKSSGTSPQYPYAQRLVCPACGEKLIQCTIDAQGSRSAWFCSGENGCGQFAVRTEHLNRAIISAYDQLNVSEIMAMACSQDSVIAEHARAAQGLKEKCPSTDAVAYYWLDEMVDAVRFMGESGIEVSWKCSLTSTISVEYRYPRERPYHIAGLLRKQMMLDWEGAE